MTCKPDLDVETTAGDTPLGALLGVAIAFLGAVIGLGMVGFILGALVRGFLWGAGL